MEKRAQWRVLDLLRSEIHGRKCSREDAQVSRSLDRKPGERHLGQVVCPEERSPRAAGRLILGFKQPRE